MRVVIENYKGICFYEGIDGYPSKCGLEIKKDKDGKTLVVLRELSDNCGTSITNWYEHLATEIYHDFLSDMPPDNIEWYEYYPKPIGSTLDRVYLKKVEGGFVEPEWERITDPQNRLQRGASC